jgi:hypothetical protein
MLLLPLLLLACQTEAPVLVQPIANPTTVASPEPTEAPPPGRIDAEPILPRPVVLGGIGMAAVEAGIAVRQAAIDDCYRQGLVAEPALRGKVLVKFTILPDGHVASATTKSTSLRHPATEDCVVAQVSAATFGPLQDGSSAIVSFPFVFGPS